MALAIFSGCTEKSEITIKSDTVLPTGVSGQSYNAQALEATGGTPPYKWTLKPGSIMPDGLKLAENGVIFGTAPVLTGGTTMRITPPFTVTVTDSAGQQQDLELRITIDIPPPTLTLKSGTGTVGKYSSIPLIVQVSGGNPPYSYQSDTFMSGTPPMGMIVDINGNLVGTPAKEGTYTFGVCAIDLGGRSSCKQTTVNVEEEPKTEMLENNLNGLWKSIEYDIVYKITQTGKDVVITIYQVGPNYVWQGDSGDIIAEGTFDGNKITGRVTLYPQKESCIGYTFSGDYDATVSEDGKTINVIYGHNRYYIQTCQEVPNSSAERSETYTRIE